MLFGFVIIGKEKSSVRNEAELLALVAHVAFHTQLVIYIILFKLYTTTHHFLCMCIICCIHVMASHCESCTLIITALLPPIS